MWCRTYCVRPGMNEESIERARQSIDESERRVVEVWRRAPIGGKIFLAVLVFVRFLLPLLAEVGVILYSWLVVLPTVHDLSYRIGIVGGIFSLILALVYQLSRASEFWLAIILVSAKPRRRRQKAE